MIRKVIGALLTGLVLLLSSSQAQTPSQRSAKPVSSSIAGTQQPLYTEYKGIRLGMLTEAVRATLGQPALPNEDQDYFVVSKKETAQIYYGKDHKVVGISVDYLDGVGAPDPSMVVGSDLEIKNGSAYRRVVYENQGFWVSYNRTSGAFVVVTITIQKLGFQ